jgi:hypothetical protein
LSNWISKYFCCFFFAHAFVVLSFQMVATEEPPTQQQQQAMPENTGTFGKIKATLLTAQDKGKPVTKVTQVAAAKRKKKALKPKEN